MTFASYITKNRTVAVQYLYYISIFFRTQNHIKRYKNINTILLRTKLYHQHVYKRFPIILTNVFLLNMIEQIFIFTITLLIYELYIRYHALITHPVFNLVSLRIVNKIVFTVKQIIIITLHIGVNQFSLPVQQLTKLLRQTY